MVLRKNQSVLDSLRDNSLDSDRQLSVDELAKMNLKSYLTGTDEEKKKMTQAKSRFICIFPKIKSHILKPHGHSTTQDSRQLPLITSSFNSKVKAPIGYTFGTHLDRKDRHQRSLSNVSKF